MSEDKKTFKIANKERALAFINFFSNLIVPLIDTYLITLTAVEQISGKNHAIKQSLLVNELHSGIKTLY